MFRFLFPLSSNVDSNANSEHHCMRGVKVTKTGSGHTEEELSRSQSLLKTILLLLRRSCGCLLKELFVFQSSIACSEDVNNSLFFGTLAEFDWANYSGICLSLMSEICNMLMVVVRVT